MPPDTRRFTCLIAGLVAAGAAGAGVVSHSAVPVVFAGAGGLLAGFVGWWPFGGAEPAPGLVDGRGAAGAAGGAGAARANGEANGAAGGASPADSPASASPWMDADRGAEPPIGLAGTGRPVGEASLDDPAEELQTLVDAESGLFTESYLLVALEARIAAARRRLRPVSIVMLDVVEGLRLGQPIVGNPSAVSSAVRATLREADTAGRLGDGRYVLVLEDTNESGAVWTVERVRSKLGSMRPGCTVWAGVACYPAHGFTLPEILEGAEHALLLAREWRQDRIEVAASD